MGMAIDGEGRAATSGAVVASTSAASVTATPAVAVPPAAAVTPVHDAVTTDVAGTHGVCETTAEQKARRSRSNSEETALILTSMMSMSKLPPASTVARHDSDSDGDGSRHSDMGEDMSGDEHDQEMDDDYAHGKGKGRVQHVHFGGPTGSKLDFTDDAGFNHRFRNESNRVKSLVTKHISIDELREHFDRPIIDVAKDFGICITLMKKICRRNGIKRWPHRQIRSLSKSIASMEAAMLSSQGSEREKYRDQILSLKLKRDSVIADPNKENSMARPKTPIKDHSTRPHTHIHAAPKLSPRSGSPTSASVAQPNTGKAGDGLSHSKGGRWTSEEHAAFLHGIRLYGKDWRRVAQVVRTRSAVQTRTHAQKYLLKFAGRFPFDAEGVELKQEPDASVGPHEQQSTPVQHHDTKPAVDDTSMAPPTSDKIEKETDGGDTASMSSSSHDDETPSQSGMRGPSASPVAASFFPSSEVTSTLSVDTASAKTSALETMAMILNSPQFGSPQFSGSFRHLAPPAIHTHSLSLSPLSPRHDDDVAMESPRGAQNDGVLATLPLLPSFVIKPGTWPSQPLPTKTQTPTATPTTNMEADGSSNDAAP